MIALFSEALVMIALFSEELRGAAAIAAKVVPRKTGVPATHGLDGMVAATSMGKPTVPATTLWASGVGVRTTSSTDTRINLNEALFTTGCVLRKRRRHPQEPQERCGAAVTR